MPARRPIKKRAKRRTVRKPRTRVVKRSSKHTAKSTTRTRRAEASPVASVPAPTPDIRRLVLLVEDDAAARSGYAEFLAESGFRVVALGAASVALEHVANEVPDIVLTDIALPDLNGFELTRALKRDPRLATTTVIGLTGHWSSQATRGARDVGMAALLLKPVAPAHLLAEVNRVLAQR